MILIGVTGYRRSGKNSVTNILTRYGFKNYGFADALRSAARAANPIISLAGTKDEAMRLLQAAKHPEDFDGYRYAYLVDTLGYERAKDDIPDFRRFLQRFGTEACRDTFGPNIWVDALDRTLQKEQPPLACISDVRFRSESDYITSTGGVLWRVVRPGYGGDDKHPSEIDIPNLPASQEIVATNLAELEEGVKQALIKTLLNYERGTNDQQRSSAAPIASDCCGGNRVSQ